MTYCIQDRHGGFRGHYIPPTGTAGHGSTWWPDFGPTSRDFSAAPRSHPTETIFEKVVKPHTNQGKSRSEATAEELMRSSPGARGVREAPQFRNPQPTRKAINAKDGHKVHETTTLRDVSLMRIEMNTRKMDKWLGDPPIHYGAKHGAPSPHDMHQAQVLERSRSAAASLGSATAPEVSRDFLEKQGLLVGRHKGGNMTGLADGSKVRKGKHNPLSRNLMLFNQELTGDEQKQRKSKAWSPADKATLAKVDALVLRNLPPPRGGWHAGGHHPKEWPGTQTRGMREFRAPVNCGEPPQIPAAIQDSQ